MLALSRRTRFVIMSASTVAALGATTLVWARIYLNTNHSKLILIKNNDHTVVVHSSANLTVNRRFEAGMITVDHELTNHFSKTMELMFEESFLLNTDGTISGTACKN
jgi:hypothetical protein